MNMNMNIESITNLGVLYPYIFGDLLNYFYGLAGSAGSIFLVLSFFGLFTLSLVMFAGRGGKILDTAAKLIVSGSGSNDDKSEDNKKMKLIQKSITPIVIQQLSNMFVL